MSNGILNDTVGGTIVGTPLELGTFYKIETDTGNVVWLTPAEAGVSGPVSKYVLEIGTRVELEYVVISRAKSAWMIVKVL